MFTVHYFHGAQDLVVTKGAYPTIHNTLEYIDTALVGSLYPGILLRSALEDMGWRENGAQKILEGRKYAYKGFWNRTAIAANLSAYAYILEGLVRLQLGFDHGNLDMGVLLLTGKRSQKSPYGETPQMLSQEIAQLYPTISLPVMVALFDLTESLALPEQQESREQTQNLENKEEELAA